MVLAAIDTVSSAVATLVRFGRGIMATPANLAPQQPLQLYEFEGCPYCRLVRETLTELDLDAMIYPCPKGGTRFRPEVMRRGGKAQFPFLVDPNTGRDMYESADIIAYLFETYGRRPTPGVSAVPMLNQVTSFAATMLRPMAGMRARRSRPAEQPLELYSFESSPFARRVRERLSELELPYLLRNVGRTRPSENIPLPIRARLGISVPPESENRRAFHARAGHIMVPYLIDPNTGRELFESAAIMRYLDETYGAG